MEAQDRIQRMHQQTRQREQSAKRSVWESLQRECPDFAETLPDWQRLAERLGGRISGVTAGPDGAEVRWGDTDMRRGGWRSMKGYRVGGSRPSSLPLEPGAYARVGALSGVFEVIAFDGTLYHLRAATGAELRAGRGAVQKFHDEQNGAPTSANAEQSLNG